MALKMQNMSLNASQLQDVADRQCGRANGLLSIIIPEQTVSRPEHRAQRSEHGAQPVAARYLPLLPRLAQQTLRTAWRSSSLRLDIKKVFHS